LQKLKEEVRNKIIEATVKEVSLRGYEKASMRVIARAAGISVSNTYNYYRNKQELFESIIEPVYRQIKSVFRQSLQQPPTQLMDGNNTLKFIDGIVNVLLQMDARQRQLLLILVEKSQGTRYEKTREEMIHLIELHLAEAIRKTGSPSQTDDNRSYTLNVIASHYIDGLLKILKDYRSPEWAATNIRVLLTYHLNGIKALM
jgi:AcrR family transcriptional regulator